ncbi:MAG: tyrosine-type recombinase/integrase [Actinobacteria bacterium]|nr:tyrosine-type recombinase/integrase [Actinomycetota bacterium]
MSAFASSLQAFFTDRLVREKGASPHTIASYRDTIRLLLCFAAARTGVEPCKLSLVLQIGPKRHERALVTFLTEPELDALIEAPDRSTWTGRRDHAIIVLLAQTGLRASELTGLRRSDTHLGTGAHATTTGKGRKQRITPLTKATVAVLRTWLAERGGRPTDPLFPTSTGKPLSRKALARRIAKHVSQAADRCPSLREKTITPHALRHTAAMRLLHAGIDTSVIALWLGHEQVETTQIYLHADLALKERALAKTKPLDSKPGRYRPPDALLDFLERL